MFAVASIAIMLAGLVRPLMLLLSSSFGEVTGQLIEMLKLDYHTPSVRYAKEEGLTAADLHSNPQLRALLRHELSLIALSSRDRLDRT